jgi:hypothetical protein
MQSSTSLRRRPDVGLWSMRDVLMARMRRLERNGIFAGYRQGSKSERIFCLFTRRHIYLWHRGRNRSRHDVMKIIITTTAIYITMGINYILKMTKRDSPRILTRSQLTDNHRRSKTEDLNSSGLTVRQHRTSVITLYIAI